MPKKTISHLTDLAGKRVLVRADLNVPLTPDGQISNDRRIRAAIPTIEHILNAEASVILMSHLGRPSGDPQKDAHLKMDEVARNLGVHLQKPVLKVDEVVGEAVEKAAGELQPGSVLVLENLRFHPGEKAGDESFAAQLAALGDIYVNDAFGTCHRTDTSMYAVPAAMMDKSRVLGFLVAKELEILEQLLGEPGRPLIGIMGGAKVSDKIGFIKSMLSRVDKLLIGGAMTYTFMKAMGQQIGSSRCEEDRLEAARELLNIGKDKIIMPIDHVIADRPAADAESHTSDDVIPEGMLGMDIGPKTRARYADEMIDAGTVVWNGPMGKYEDEPFSHGTRAVAQAMLQAPGVTIVGGGETAEAVESFGLVDKMTHVSTGGGAFLEYIEGSPFKALELVEDQ